MNSGHRKQDAEDLHLLIYLFKLLYGVMGYYVLICQLCSNSSGNLTLEQTSMSEELPKMTETNFGGEKNWVEFAFSGPVFLENAKLYFRFGHLSTQVLSFLDTGSRV